MLGPLGYILVLYAMKHAPIGHVAPMRELATLIGTYFGARLLKEPVTPMRLTGAVLIVSGVVTLAATGHSPPKSRPENQQVGTATREALRPLKDFLVERVSLPD